MPYRSIIGVLIAVVVVAFMGAGVAQAKGGPGNDNPSNPDLPTVVVNPNASDRAVERSPVLIDETTNLPACCVDVIVIGAMGN